MFLVLSFRERKKIEKVYISPYSIISHLQLIPNKRKEENAHKMIIQRHNHIHHDNTNNFSEKMPTTLEYIQSLEEERKKIQVFQRDLPLCLQLVIQAIEECKQRLLEKENECNFRGQSECSEQTSTEGPAFEEFIPLKKTSSSDYDDNDDDEHRSQNSKNTKDILKDSKNNKKSDWLRSVQLWNHTPDPPHTQMESPKRVSVMEVRRNGSGGAFHPFKKDVSVGPTQAVVTDNRSSAPAVAASSTAETGGGEKGKKEEKERQSQGKHRRCWSPELHKRFLQALQQLGGSNVATPKQIRELMKVDGLTNDEVKSHLQKYRLHHRRTSFVTHNHHHQQPPQFVVVGGLWVPPPDYGAMTTTSPDEEASANAASNVIYTPLTALATPFQDASLSGKPRQQEREPSLSAGHDINCSGGGVDSHASSASLSSTETTTTSPN